MKKVRLDLSRKRGRWARAFLRNKRGSTAIEFSLVATPFFMLVFATMEVGMLFFVSSTVDEGLNNAARKIRTGEVQTDGLTKQDLITSVCESLTAFGGDCADRLTIEVLNFNSFGSVASGAVICDESSGGPTAFSAGTAGDVIMVRVCYAYKVITPGMGGLLADMGDGKSAVVSTIVFRNEPFEDILPTT